MTQHYLAFLETVALEDVANLKLKEKSYGDSWKKRGGIGAFMMLARKWDRIEGMLKNNTHSFMEGPYDVFGMIKGFPGGEDSTVLAEIRDLRRYLVLVEAEMMARGDVKPASHGNPIFVPAFAGHVPGTPEDGGHHAKQDFLLDGWTEEPTWAFIQTLVDGHAVYNVDRRKLAQDLWDHLPRLRLELNGTEYKETPMEYQGMYAWIETQEKYILDFAYREHWGIG